MKAESLRIGNIIERYTDVFGKGWSWTRTSHEDIYSIACGENEKYRPIPLTEEWLAKFGFIEYSDWVNGKTNTWDKLSNKGRIESPSFNYDHNTSRVQILHERNSISHHLNGEYRYVHQLQNLYFALTGEELTIKE